MHLKQTLDITRSNALQHPKTVATFSKRSAILNLAIAESKRPISLQEDAGDRDAMMRKISNISLPFTQRKK
jgi:hypothetical protein